MRLFNTLGMLVRDRTKRRALWKELLEGDFIIYALPYLCLASTLFLIIFAIVMKLSQD